jgi:hypothetical protein
MNSIFSFVFEIICDSPGIEIGPDDLEPLVAAVSVESQKIIKSQQSVLVRVVFAEQLTIFLNLLIALGCPLSNILRMCSFG